MVNSLTLIIGAVIVYKWVKKKVLGVVLLILAVLPAGSETAVLAYARVGPVDEDYGIHVTCTS